MIESLILLFLQIWAVLWTFRLIIYIKVLNKSKNAKLDFDGKFIFYITLYIISIISWFL